MPDFTAAQSFLIGVFSGFTFAWALMMLLLGNGGKR